MSHAQSWSLQNPDESALIVGRDQDGPLQAANVSLPRSVLVKASDGTEHGQLSGKAVKPNEGKSLCHCKVPSRKTDPAW